MPALNMTIGDVANHLLISRQQLHRILSEKAAITPEMALRLGQFCGNGPDLWIRMQQALDLWNARIAIASEMKRIPPSGMLPQPTSRSSAAAGKKKKA